MRFVLKYASPPNNTCNFSTRHLREERKTKPTTTEQQQNPVCANCELRIDNFTFKHSMILFERKQQQFIHLFIEYHFAGLMLENIHFPICSLFWMILSPPSIVRQVHAFSIQQTYYRLLGCLVN